MKLKFDICCWVNTKNFVLCVFDCLREKPKISTHKSSAEGDFWMCLHSLRLLIDFMWVFGWNAIKSIEIFWYDKFFILQVEKSKKIKIFKISWKSWKFLFFILFSSNFSRLTFQQIFSKPQKIQLHFENFKLISSISKIRLKSFVFVFSESIHLIKNFLSFTAETTNI
jgi:hypothetical protein